MVQFPSEVLEELRLHLEEEKKRLNVQLTELSAQDPFTNGDRSSDKAASDMEASDESDHDRVSAVTDEVKAKIAEVDGALARIGDGTYGVCSVCGEMIDTDRLSILPTATLCLKHSK